MQYREELIETVKKLTQDGKGILAADESPTTLKLKFDKIKLEMLEENQRNYREILFTTGDLSKYISGVILYKETVLEKTAAGAGFVQYLSENGIVAGIKLDEGLVELLPGSQEKYTKGMDTLLERAKKAYELGCRFAKWRCVLKLVDGQSPSELSIHETSYTLARYASVCQQAGLVPIVEPELLTDGSHSIETCAKASRKIFAGVMKALQDYEILFEGCLLKPHMITQGADFAGEKNPNEVARLTVEVLRETVPVSMGGVFFLSGGQGEKEATKHLHLINQESNKRGKAWPLRFSFGRALQNSAVLSWTGKKENIVTAQKVFLARAEMNHLAALGQYKEEEDKNEFGAEEMHQKDYAY